MIIYGPRPRASLSMKSDFGKSESPSFYPYVKQLTSPHQLTSQGEFGGVMTTSLKLATLEFQAMILALCPF